MDAGGKKRDRPHPRDSANPLSALLISWTLDIFQKGYKKELDVDDLYTTLDEHRSSYLGDRIERLWNKELKQACANNRKPSLVKVLIKCVGLRTTILGIMTAASDLVFKVTQPIFMGGLIRYFSKDSDVTRDTAFMYAGAIALCSALNVIIRQAIMLAYFHLGMKVRVSLCSLVYRKALRLSKAALRQTTVGQAINLLSNDVSRFDACLILLVYLWFGPLLTLIILYLMWLQIGFAAVFGVATIFVGIPLQAYLGRMMSTLRLRTAKRTDERIRFMNEIIVGIQVIKMYAWEKPFAHLVSLARKKEVQAIRGANYVRAFLLSFEKYSTKLAVFVSIVTYAALGNQITAEKMFVVVGFMNILNKIMTDFFPRSIGYLSEALVSAKRVQTYLLFDEIETEKRLTVKHGSTILTIPDDKKPVEEKIATNGTTEMKVIKSKTDRSVTISNVTAKWNSDLPENTLTNVSFEVRPRSLVAVIGPVGSGKTSLLHAILKELPLNSGSISVGGSISYASQEPWLFTGSVQQNILFGESMDRSRYKKVVRACALERDFQLLPHGDKTIVGDRGVTMSGGQRARVNLARAIYKKADIYILDDPLSAVDAHVGRHLFDDCISDFLHGKTRILVTHQLQYLQTVDKIVILDNGKVDAIGTYAELHDSGLHFAKQLEMEMEPEDDSKNRQTLMHSESQISNISTGRQMSIISECSSLDELEFVPKPVQEMRKKGRVSSGVYLAYYTSGTNLCTSLFIISLYVVAQIISSMSDYWMSFWTNLEEKRYKVPGETAFNTTSIVTNVTTPFLDLNFTTMASTVFEWVGVSHNSTNSTAGEPTFTTTVAAEDTTSFLNLDFTTVVPTVFDWVGMSLNSTTSTFGNISTFVATTVNTPFLDIDITTIAPSVFGLGWMPSTETCIYVYTALVIGIIVFTIASSLSFINLCMKASVNLHNKMFNSITRATMLFFNTNPSGQILNRFAKDTGAIDDILPQTMMDCIQRILLVLGVIIIVAIVNFWLLIPTVLMFILFYMLRVYYMHTSRSLKRLEGITRSPVFSHLNASVQGLTTIRAFGAESLLEKEFDNHQDLHSTTYYLFISVNRAFGLWLDGICVVYIGLVAVSFLLLGGDQYGGDVGLAITQATNLTGLLQWGMRQITELENQMTSVERVLEYTDVEKEPPLESLPNKKPSESWPTKGTVVFDQVFLSYSKDEPAVLRNVDFTINPTEKIGIVGRTGAGKSTLITALFRLVDCSSGSICIDEVPISSIGLHDLRSKISIIPQEPFLFSGILRENLDPFEEFSDAVLWSALEEVELKHAIDDLPAGLNHVVSEGGSNFSVGQRQLLCLARAIIRNNKILVLDEATANVDPQTDELIQKTIRHKFKDCTVMTIAHRLNTIIDSDRIIVMDAGSVAEFDHPYLLLKNEKSNFYQMVQETGHAMAESLFKAARAGYEDKHKS